MALLINQLQWSDEPLVPETVDPAFEAEVRALIHSVPHCFRRIASSAWVRNAYLDAIRCPLRTLTDPEVELIGLVTSQENACRYCYGVARTRLKMMGFSDEMIDRIERNAQLVEADPKESQLVTFVRNLARSKPRPSRKAREDLIASGYSPLATAEIAFGVLAVGFCNRVSTLLAVPPELEMEAAAPPKGLWKKLSSWLPGRHAPARLPLPSYPEPTFTGPFGRLVSLIDGSPAAAILEVTLNRAFESEVLPRRTLALMFAVVARTLECDLCETGAADLLAREGMSRADLAEVLRTLASPKVTEVERLLVPWARDTVWMPEQPARIQERTRPLLDALGPRVLVEAIGGAALANGCVRLAMLQQ